MLRQSRSALRACPLRSWLGRCFIHTFRPPVLKKMNRKVTAKEIRNPRSVLCLLPSVLGPLALFLSSQTLQTSTEPPPQFPRAKRQSEQFHPGGVRDSGHANGARPF